MKSSCTLLQTRHSVGECSALSDCQFCVDHSEVSAGQPFKNEIRKTCVDVGDENLGERHIKRSKSFVPIHSANQLGSILRRSDPNDDLSARVQRDVVHPVCQPRREPNQVIDVLAKCRTSNRPSSSFIWHGRSGVGHPVHTGSAPPRTRLSAGPPETTRGRMYPSTYLRWRRHRCGRTRTSTQLATQAEFHQISARQR